MSENFVDTDEKKAKSIKNPRLAVALSLLAVAILCFVGCIIFLFIGNEKITDIPSTLQVKLVDGKYHLMAEHQDKYRYRFKIEQKLDNYYAISTLVDSESNVLDLSLQKLTLSAGNQYRFSVCYRSLDNVFGEYCTPIEWTSNYTLDKVTDIEFRNNSLVWKEVLNADYYTVNVYWQEETVVTSTTNSLNVNDFSKGVYTVLITAHSNTFYRSSTSNSFTFEIY